MYRKKWDQTAYLLSMILIVLVPWHLARASSLTLSEAERVAVSQSPEIKSVKAKQDALKESSIAAGQLADPKIMLGAMNLPVDTYDFRQEPMTQLQIGLQQNFPRGQSLKYRSLSLLNLSKAEMQKQRMTQLQVLQGVRHSWLNLYLWIKSEEIIFKQKKIFQHLVKVSESMLANNKAQQKDVIRAQLELSELSNRLFYITQKIESARAGLGRWIGQEQAERARPRQLPSWQKLPKNSEMHLQLYQHPMLLMDRDMIASSRFNINLAKQQYKPGFALSAGYGVRQGRNVNQTRRADFVSGKINMDLPLFIKNRQDRSLKASQLTLVASEESRTSHTRELNQTLNTQYAVWRQQNKSAQYYFIKLIPAAKQYAEATMSAYQNNLTDFPTLARAYVRELNTELAGLKARVNREMARINILYLQGK